MARGKIKAKPIISHEFALAEARAAFDVQMNRPTERIKVQMAPEG